MNNKIIIMLGALALIGLCFAPWFTMPKIGNISLFNILQLALEAGFKDADSVADYLFLLFFIYPVMLILTGLKGFEAPRIISIIGGLSVIAFMILTNHQSGGMANTAFGSWVSMIIYFLIAGASHYFIMQEKKSPAIKPDAQ